MPDSPLTASLQRLVGELRRLPGVGPRSAERIAFHILKATRDDALLLARAIEDVKNDIRPCTRCFNLAEGDLCAICSDPRRDHSVIFVVEQPKDLISLESTGLTHAAYHVLMGRIAPLEGVSADDLTIDALIRRVKAGGTREVVLATNPTVEGDATALHITSLLRDIEMPAPAPTDANAGGAARTSIRVTRLARGLAPGAHIEHANRSMLEEAVRGRHEF